MVSLADKIRPWSTVDVVRPQASYRTDLVTALLGVWFVVGLFLDAWAHNNLSELETFFTPWHGVFYSGFVVTAAWICWAVVKQLLAGKRGLAAVPVGYALGLVGIPIFAAAGVGDMLWHTVLGIETSLDILFSPTHILLGVGMTLMITCPLRSAWGDGTATAPSLRRLLPALVSVGFATTLVMLLLQYVNALVWSPLDVVQALSKDSSWSPGPGPMPSQVAASIVVTNVLLVAPLLLLARRWRLPAGAATIQYAAAGGLAAAVTQFGFPAVLAAVVLSGLAVDALLAALRPGPARRGAFLAFAGLASAVTWAFYIGVLSLDVGRLPAVAEFWTGIPVFLGVQGLLLGVLMAPHVLAPHAPAAAPPPASPSEPAESEAAKSLTGSRPGASVGASAG